MYLGIDIGTSSVKAVVMNGDGAVIGQSGAPLDVSRPKPLWSEQNPLHWWDATCTAVKRLDADARRAVRSIGLSGQMHGATLLGKDDTVLRPAILWNDGRSGAECAELEAAISGYGDITGNRFMPGFTAPKLQWIRKHEPDIFAQVATVLLPKDFVRLHMTGDKASDMSDSAGTVWMDVARRDWSDTVLEATGLTRAHMPALYEGSEVTGQLTADVAQDWGMERVPVVAGGGDNAAGAVGMGVVKAGEAFLSLGTSGVLFLANGAFTPNPDGGVHSFCHALPDRWHQMSVILSAASALDWAAKLCGLNNTGALIAGAEARGRTADEIFLPYLSGERTPHNDPGAKGALFGMTHDTDAAAIGQAVMEGVAFAFRDGLDALTQSGAAVDTISVIGGGARSRYWGTILASALERPLIYREGGEVGPAYGAARLAQIGDGAAIDDVCTAPPAAFTISPDGDLTSAYRSRMPAFRALYRNTNTLL